MRTILRTLSDSTTTIWQPLWKLSRVLRITVSRKRYRRWFFLLTDFHLFPVKTFGKSKSDFWLAKSDFFGKSQSDFWLAKSFKFNTPGL
jgi:hypothetical protein